LRTFDDARFLPYLLRCRQAGIDFPTMADLGDTVGCRRALYELNKTCAADIPGRGEFYTFAEYVQQRLTPPGYDPHGVILALSKDDWIGMAATSLRRDESCAVSDMTGVLPGYRGRGISMAMKLLAIGYARSNGMRWLNSLHHPANAAAIGMNRRLGFVNYEPLRLVHSPWLSGFAGLRSLTFDRQESAAPVNSFLTAAAAFLSMRVVAADGQSRGHGAAELTRGRRLYACPRSGGLPRSGVV
jgi:GNAT superfamily N-acetyltransferase